MNIPTTIISRTPALRGPAIVRCTSIPRLTAVGLLVAGPIATELDQLASLYWQGGTAKIPVSAMFPGSQLRTALLAAGVRYVFAL